MKKILLSGLMLLALTSSQNAFAGKHHEFGFGYGLITHNQVAEFASDVKTNFDGATSLNVSKDVFEVDDLEFSGSYSFHYVFHPINFLGIGLIGSYQTSEGDVVAGGDLDDVFSGFGFSFGDLDLPVGSVKNKYITIMPQLSLSWFDLKVFSMYSKFAIGYTFLKSEYDYVDGGSEKNSDKRFALQISPISFEAGIPALRLFAEFGYGNQGIVNMGVKLRL